MDKFVVVQRKRKRSSSRERDFCKRDRNDTSSCSESASQVFSSENDIGNFVGVPLTDADRRKVLFNCWSPPSGFSFPYVTVGAQNRSFQKQWLNEFTRIAHSNTVPFELIDSARFFLTSLMFEDIISILNSTTKSPKCCSIAK